MLLEEFSGFYTVHAGHFNIHQHHITGTFADILQYIIHIGVGTRACKILCSAQQQLKGFPQVFIVFKNADSYQGDIFTKVKNYSIAAIAKSGDSQTGIDVVYLTLSKLSYVTLSLSKGFCLRMLAVRGFDGLSLTIYFSYVNNIQTGTTSFTMVPLVASE